MRPVPPRLWPAAVLLVVLAGCQSPDRVGDSLPGGLVPYSHRTHAAADASRLVTPPDPTPDPPRPRKSVALRHDAPQTAPSPPPRPAAPAAVIEWHADLRSTPTSAWIDRPVPAPDAPARIAVNDRPVYAHAADYRWLVGCLVHDADLKRWSIRYASPGEPDLHDGQLELVATGPMGGFHSGQTVRVEGELVDPQPHQIKPAYRARVLQLLRR